MISIEAHRAAIGRFTNRFHKTSGTSMLFPFPFHFVDNLCTKESLCVFVLLLSLSILLASMFIVSVAIVLLPLSIFVALMSVVVMSTDMVVHKFCNYRSMFHIAKRNLVLYNPRAEHCYFVEENIAPVKVKSDRLLAAI